MKALKEEKLEACLRAAVKVLKEVQATGCRDGIPNVLECARLVFDLPDDEYVGDDEFEKKKEAYKERIAAHKKKLDRGNKAVEKALDNLERTLFGTSKDSSTQRDRWDDWGDAGL